MQALTQCNCRSAVRLRDSCSASASCWSGEVLGASGSIPTAQSSKLMPRPAQISPVWNSFRAVMSTASSPRASPIVYPCFHELSTSRGGDQLFVPCFHELSTEIASGEGSGEGVSGGFRALDWRARATTSCRHTTAARAGIPWHRDSTEFPAQDRLHSVFIFYTAILRMHASTARKTCSRRLRSHATQHQGTGALYPAQALHLASLQAYLHCQAGDALPC